MAGAAVTNSEWISVSVAARILQRSRTSVVNYIESGLLRGRRIGERGWWQVARADVEKLLNSSLETR
jgi:hypothetical protein